MQSLNRLIAESLDNETVSSDHLWQAVTQRAAIKIPRRMPWSKYLTAVAAIALGTLGTVTITGSTEASGLPSTDFDVHLAPNFSSMLEPRPMSQDDLERYRIRSAFEPIKAVVYCHSTPYGSAPVGPNSNFYLTREDVDSLDERDIIEECVRGAYATDIYAKQFAEAKSMAALDARTPNMFAVCVSEADPTAISVLPGYSGVQNDQQMCQNNAMHPMSLQGEERAAVEIRSNSEYAQWLKRHQSFPLNYGDGFSTFSANDWTNFLRLRTEGISA